MPLAHHHRPVHDLSNFVLPILKPRNQPLKPWHVRLDELDIVLVQGLFHLGDKRFAVAVALLRPPFRWTRGSNDTRGGGTQTRLAGIRHRKHASGLEHIVIWQDGDKNLHVKVKKNGVWSPDGTELDMTFNDPRHVTDGW